MSQLCKAGVQVVITEKGVTAYDIHNNTCLHGLRDDTTGLYMVQLPSKETTAPPPGLTLEHALMAYPAHTQKQMLEFAIATMASATTSTLLKAIRLGLDIPGLTTMISHLC